MGKRKPVARMINGIIFGLSTPARHANANANPVPTILNKSKPPKLKDLNQ